jgi:peptide/nickel transport system ATP-binding protein
MWFRRRKRRSLESADRFPSAPPDVPLLEVDSAQTSFVTDRGTVRAVDGVTFSLERGRTLGIVGESGCGKTVLSRSVMGLLPKHNVVRSGSVRFEGQEIGDWEPDQMRPLWGTQMAMVFQDPMTSLNPVMSIGNQITEPLLYHFDISSGYARELAVALLQSVGIPEPDRRLRQFPHELSGGMRQRVMIAIAIASGPKLLFADEPTTSLDVTVQAQILDLLQTQQRERYMAMILVTHDLGVVAGRTDDIAVMYAGRIVEKAPTRVLFSQPRMPYTEALLASIPKLGDAAHSRLATIPGRPPNLIHPPQGCKFSPRCAYVQDKCRVEEPPLRPGPEGKHEFACWFPVGTPEGRAAFESNKKAGVAAVEARLGGETVPVEGVS